MNEHPSPPTRPAIVRSVNQNAPIPSDALTERVTMASYLSESRIYSSSFDPSGSRNASVPFIHRTRRVRRLEEAYSQTVYSLTISTELEPVPACGSCRQVRSLTAGRLVLQIQRGLGPPSSIPEPTAATDLDQSMPTTYLPVSDNRFETRHEEPRPTDHPFALP
jgi:hypothetical protein